MDDIKKINALIRKYNTFKDMTLYLQNEMKYILSRIPFPTFNEYGKIDFKRDNNAPLDEHWMDEIEVIKEGTNNGK